jgi:acyl-CoA synthetase (AMP-forming)/AMP-acid ligase II
MFATDMSIDTDASHKGAKQGDALERVIERSAGYAGDISTAEGLKEYVSWWLPMLRKLRSERDRARTGFHGSRCNLREWQSRMALGGNRSLGTKCPEHVYFRNELPKTNVGKILRRALREELPK